MVVGCTLRLCIGPKKSSDSTFDQSVDPKESHGFLIVKVLGPMRFMRERDYALFVFWVNCLEQNARSLLTP